MSGDGWRSSLSSGGSEEGCQKVLDLDAAVKKRAAQTALMIPGSTGLCFALLAAKNYSELGQGQKEQWKNPTT